MQNIYSNPLYKVNAYRYVRLGIQLIIVVYEGEAFLFDDTTGFNLRKNVDLSLRILSTVPCYVYNDLSRAIDKATFEATQ